jgi:cytochrome P450
VSDLIAVTKNDPQGIGLTQAELVGACTFLLFGGHETTTNLIGSSTHSLLANRSEFAWLEGGQTVFLGVASANRDPAMFDGPDRLWLDRADAQRHLGFGYGIHFCVGASLARLEAQIALEALVRRFPHMERGSGDLERSPAGSRPQVPARRHQAIASTAQTAVQPPST